MTSPKETNKVPVTDPKEMEIHKLLDIKIIILRKSSELQENINKQLEIRKTIHEQNEKFNK